MTPQEQQEGLKLLEYIKNEISEVSLLHVLTGDLEVGIHSTIGHKDPEVDGCALCLNFTHLKRWCGTSYNYISVNYSTNKERILRLYVFPHEGLEHIIYEIKKLGGDIDDSFSPEIASISTDDPKLIIEAIKNCLNLNQ